METSVQIEKEKRFALKMAFGAGYAIFALVVAQYFSPQEALGFYDASASKSLAAAQVQAVSGGGKPSRIKIPAIGVDAVIQGVGLLKDGSMGVPKKPADTAWYNLGPKPGEKGSAVIAGHLNWFYGAKGVFERLDKLKAGDSIIAQDDKGLTKTFVVRRTGYFGHQDDATEVFYSNDGKAHLNLVTCAGTWNKFLQRYNKRLVVFADEVVE